MWGYSPALITTAVLGSPISVTLTSQLIQGNQKSPYIALGPKLTGTSSSVINGIAKSGIQENLISVSGISSSNITVLTEICSVKLTGQSTSSDKAPIYIINEELLPSKSFTVLYPTSVNNKTEYSYPQYDVISSFQNSDVEISWSRTTSITKQTITSAIQLLSPNEYTQYQLVGRQIASNQGILKNKTDVVLSSLLSLSLYQEDLVSKESEGIKPSSQLFQFTQGIVTLSASGSTSISSVIANVIQNAVIPSSIQKITSYSGVSLNQGIILEWVQKYLTTKIITSISGSILPWISSLQMMSMQQQLLSSIKTPSSFISQLFSGLSITAISNDILPDNKLSLDSITQYIDINNIIGNLSNNINGRQVSSFISPSPRSTITQLLTKQFLDISLPYIDYKLGITLDLIEAVIDQQKSIDYYNSGIIDLLVNNPINSSIAFYGYASQISPILNAKQIIANQNDLESNLWVDLLQQELNQDLQDIDLSFYYRLKSLSFNGYYHDVIPSQYFDALSQSINSDYGIDLLPRIFQNMDNQTIDSRYGDINFLFSHTLITQLLYSKQDRVLQRIREGLDNLFFGPTQGLLSSNIEEKVTKPNTFIISQKEQLPPPASKVRLLNTTLYGLNGNFKSNNRYTLSSQNTYSILSPIIGNNYYSYGKFLFDQEIKSIQNDIKPKLSSLIGFQKIHSKSNFITTEIELRAISSQLASLFQGNLIENYLKNLRSLVIDSIANSLLPYYSLPIESQNISSSLYDLQEVQLYQQLPRINFIIKQNPLIMDHSLLLNNISILTNQNDILNQIYQSIISQNINIDNQQLPDFNILLAGLFNNFDISDVFPRIILPYDLAYAHVIFEPLINSVIEE
jgi:hypothetical protein